MRITREADYAMRIIVMLAAAGEQLDAKIISDKNDIPYRFTLKILRKLVQANIINSFRGVNGGYVLAKAPSDITMREVIETIDGPIAINRCLEDPDICKNNSLCRVQKKLFHIQQVIESELDKISFEDILKEDI